MFNTKKSIAIIVMLVATIALGIFSLYRIFQGTMWLSTPMLIAECLIFVLPLIVLVLFITTKREKG